VSYIKTIKPKAEQAAKPKEEKAAKKEKPKMGC
jgi:hypothetical protein